SGSPYSSIFSSLSRSLSLFLLLLFDCFCSSDTQLWETSLVCCLAGFIAILLLPVLAKNTYISENALMPDSTNQRAVEERKKTRKERKKSDGHQRGGRRKSASHRQPEGITPLALIPCSANPVFSYQDVTEANKFIAELLHWKSKKFGSGIDVPRLVAKYMTSTGSDVYHHRFQPSKKEFHPLQFFSRSSCSGMVHDDGNSSSPAVNIVGVIRAPQGDGKESIVLVTPYNPEAISVTDAFSLGLAFSIFSHLSQVSWLAKDVVWLAADSRYGEYTSVASWLRVYYDPYLLCNSGDYTKSTGTYISLERAEESPEEVNSEAFRRAGAIAAALVIKIANASQSVKDTVQILAEASNGQMPNLDLINVVHYLAVHRQGLDVKIGTVSSLVKSIWLKMVGDLFEWVSETAGSVNPQWKFAIPASDFLEGTATLASSMYQQALGIPTGLHGAFRDYQVDAVTLEISPKTSLDNDMLRTAFILKMGRLVEGTIRSVNNLLEKFHQSFFLYLLTAPNRFVSVGIYMIPFMLLILPLPVLAAALYLGKSSSDFSNAANLVDYSKVNKKQSLSQHAHDLDPSFSLPSWQWVNAVKIVLLVHAWAAIVSVLPCLLDQLPNRAPTTSFFVWIVLSTLLLLSTWYSCSTCQGLVGGLQEACCNNWAVLKAATVGFASIGLGLMSVINFATAQIGAMLLVPMCLFVHPIKHICKAVKMRAAILIISNLVFGVLGFPPAAFLLLKGMSEGFSNVTPGDFVDWVETLWSWNSATYLYIFLVQLPCWVLCLFILLHR
ncbi:Glycosylphosphatidylinositol anchor attachment 1 protein, partial [Nymphaea thermarum]